MSEARGSEDVPGGVGAAPGLDGSDPRALGRDRARRDRARARTLLTEAARQLASVEERAGMLADLATACEMYFKHLQEAIEKIGGRRKLLQNALVACRRERYTAQGGVEWETIRTGGASDILPQLVAGVLPVAENESLLETHHSCVSTIVDKLERRTKEIWQDIEAKRTEERGLRLEACELRRTVCDGFADRDADYDRDHAGSTVGGVETTHSTCVAHEAGAGHDPRVRGAGRSRSPRR